MPQYAAGTAPHGRPRRSRQATGTAAIAALTALAFTIPGAPVARAAVPTFVPCTGSGGGGAGLVTAINKANQAKGGAIVLAPLCTYSLTTPATPPGPFTGGFALPEITSPITIVGNNSTIQRAANAASDFGIFEVQAGGTLTAHLLTISGGRGVCSGGVFGCFFGGLGGGIANQGGVVSLNGSRVVGNSSTGACGTSGFVFCDGADAGGIGNLGTLKLTGSQVTGNTATLDCPAGAFCASPLGGGIYNNGFGSTVSLVDSQVTNNTASCSGAGFCAGQGGGIFASAPRTVTLVLSSVTNNHPDNCKPAGYVPGCKG